MVNTTSKIYQDSGLEDNLFVELCKVRIPTNIPGILINIPVIIPSKEGNKKVLVSKYFDYAMRNTLRVMIGEPNYPVIIDKDDLTPDTINELQSLHPYVRNNILKKSFLRIYEITSPLNCYHSIAQRLQVTIKALEL